MIKRCLSVFLCWWMAVAIIVASDFQLELKVNNRSPSVGEPIELRIEMTGTDLQSVSQLQTPDLRVFSVGKSSEETSYKAVGGALQITRVRILKLTPIKSGTIAIKPAVVTYKGESFRSNSVTLTVRNESGSVATTQGKTGLLLRSEVSAQTVRVGQPIQYRLKVYRQFTFKENPTLRIPIFQGFFQSARPVDNTPQKKEINGQTYYVTEVVRRELYAAEAGQFTIADGAIIYRVNPPNSPKITTVAPPVTIKVTPLPSPKPDGFLGAVGDFTLSTSHSRYSGTQYAPIAIKVVVKGSGNFASVSEVKMPSHPSVKWTKSTVSNQGSGDTVTGRVLQYLVVPQTSGKINLGAVTLVAFSPDTGTYVTVQSPPIRLVVSKGTAATAALDKQTRLPILPLRPFILAKEQSVFVIGFLFWTVFMGTIGIIFVAIAIALNRRYVRNNRVEIAWKQADVIALKLLAQWAQSPTDPGVALGIYRSVQQFFSSKMRLAVEGLDDSGFVATLRRFGADDSTVSLILTWRQKGESLAFSPGPHDVSQLREFVQLSIRIVELNRGLGGKVV